ncbi:hypothetical protein [Rubrivirga sp. IMCC43871]|uniref:hypothetical protein n=1 Tax=Rubrivirga sp. IMCC43871 TaxID=3391575 RepID=UPI00399008E4
MRLTLVLALLLPASAAAQIDLTATPKSVRYTLQFLQQQVHPRMSPSEDPVEWCIADAYRIISEQSTNSRIEAASLRVAAQYEAHATRRLQRRPAGLTAPEGTEVVVHVTDRAVCRTRARVPTPSRG